MKNKTTFLLFFINVIFSVLHLSPLLWRGAGGEVFSQTHWMTLLNTPRVEYKSDIKQTLDSGYIIIGSQPFLSSNFDLVKSYPTLTKLNKNGMVQWNKDISSPKEYLHNNEGNMKVEPTSDGGYLVISNRKDAQLIKMNSSGNVQWTKSYGYYVESKIGTSPTTGENSQFYSIQQAKDGDYIVAGSTSNFGQQGNPTGGGVFGGEFATDVYLVKLSTSGAVKWAKTYGNSTLYEEAYSVRQTKDGGYILVGTNDLPGSVNERAGFLLKTDDLGNVLWSKDFATNYYYQGNFSSFSGVADSAAIGAFYNVEETNDGGYIVTGDIGNTSAPTSSSLFKFDGLGNLQWSKGYTVPYTLGLLRASKAYQTGDSGYMVYGAIGGTSANGNYPQSFLLKTDVTGDIQWTKTYGIEGVPDQVYPYKGGMPGGFEACILTKDKGYVFMGRTVDTIVGGHFNTYGFNNVTKTDSLGNNGTCQNTWSSQTRLYPPAYIHSNNYDVMVGVASYSVAQSITVTDFLLTTDSSICLKAPVKAILAPSKICENGVNEISFINAGYGELYEWNFGDTASGSNNFSTLTNPTYKYPGVATYTVVLTVYDTARSVTHSDTTSVYILPNKFITVSNDITICIGDSTLISATGWDQSLYWEVWLPTDIKWRDVYYTTQKYVKPTSTTKYIAVNYNGACEGRDSVLVTVVTAPTITIDGNKTLCQGTSTTLSANGGNYYLWNTGETSSVITITPSQNVSYSVTAFNDGCSVTSSVNIAVLPSYTVNAGANATILFGEEIILTPTTTGTVSWSPSIGLDCINCQTPKAKPLVTTTYYAITKNGDCTSVDSVTIFVIDCDEAFTIPNAFSPNNDGINEVLILSGTSCFTTIQFTIYNRWGEKVFETDDLSITWEGKYKNMLLDNGVFVYSLTATLVTGDVLEKKGNVSIIR